MPFPEGEGGLAQQQQLQQDVRNYADSEGNVTNSIPQDKAPSSIMETKKEVFNTKIFKEEANEVYKKATIAQVELNGTLSKVAKELGISYEMSKQKSLNSIISKAQRKSANESEYSLYNMKDHARGKLELNDFSQIPEVLSSLIQKNIPFDTESIDPTEWGHRGFHVTFRNGDNISNEIQLTRPDVWKVKLESDAIYEKWRNITDLSALTYEERKQRASDRQKSLNMWNQLNLFDFTSLATSSVDSLRALNSSSDDTGRTALDQRPLENSNISPPLRHSESSNNRSDSVIHAIKSSPSNNSIQRKINRYVESVEFAGF